MLLYEYAKAIAVLFASVVALTLVFGILLMWRMSKEEEE